MHLQSRKFNKQKAFGQHFLKDQNVIQEIVGEALRALARNPSTSVLEIGPGKGALTHALIEKLPKGTPLILAERDRELIEYWKNDPGFNRISAKILEGDFLDHADSELTGLGPCIVVSNLPYSAGTAIVVRLVELGIQNSKQYPEMILMFQAEVAKRLYAEPSTPDRGSLSLFTQNYFDVKKIISVKPSAFQPPPKVMSEVVHLVIREQPLVKTETPEKISNWNELLKTAFAQRRKMLRGNFSGSRWKSAFEQSGVDPTKRAESLNWEEWKAIWQKRS